METSALSCVTAFYQCAQKPQIKSARPRLEATKASESVDFRLLPVPWLRIHRNPASRLCRHLAFWQAARAPLLKWPRPLSRHRHTCPLPGCSRAAPGAACAASQSQSLCVRSMSESIRQGGGRRIHRRYRGWGPSWARAKLTLSGSVFVLRWAEIVHLHTCFRHKRHTEVATTVRILHVNYTRRQRLSMVYREVFGDRNTATETQTLK